jgi:hypothetical protein
MKSRFKLLAALSLLFSLASPALAQELTPEQRQQIAHKIVTLSAKVKPHEVVLIEGNAVFLPFSRLHTRCRRCPCTRRVPHSCVSSESC